MNTLYRLLTRIRGGIDTHSRVLWALLMREVSTRYGRSNIGFIWLIAEPLIFAGTVTLMWSVIKGQFERGIPVTAFTVIGYMAVLLSRHMINHGVNCVKANAGLLYHRHITILHLFMARLFLEFVSVTLSFITIYSVMVFFGLMHPPSDLPMLYLGWATLGWLSFSVAMILGAVAEIIEFTERFVLVITYVLIPLSGTFFMVQWLPAYFRKTALLMPFIDTTEMIRAGYFGSSVRTYFNVPYTFACCMILTFFGLLIVRFVREHVEVE